MTKKISPNTPRFVDFDSYIDHAQSIFGHVYDYEPNRASWNGVTNTALKLYCRKHKHKFVVNAGSHIRLGKRCMFCDQERVPLKSMPGPLTPQKNRLRNFNIEEPNFNERLSIIRQHMAAYSLKQRKLALKALIKDMIKTLETKQ